MQPCVLVFAGGSGSSPAQAIEAARLLPGYHQQRTGDGVEHLVPVEPGSLAALQPLLLLVMSDPATRLLVDGVAVGRERLWELLRLTSCRRGSLMTDDPERCWGATGAHRGVVPCRMVNRTLGSSLACGEIDSTELDTTLQRHEADALVALCPVYDRVAVHRAAAAAIDRLSVAAS